MDAIFVDRRAQCTTPRFSYSNMSTKIRPGVIPTTYTYLCIRCISSSLLFNLSWRDPEEDKKKPFCIAMGTWVHWGKCIVDTTLALRKMRAETTC
mmetsp:Transcript_6768/g.14656  ORF Transcript_6768/g.14656 Transcript_6768/m.14656 type:complete len:95 (-) Transcript_6768:196-480(-)